MIETIYTETECFKLITDTCQYACKQNNLWVLFFVVGFLLNFMAKYIFDISIEGFTPEDKTKLYTFMKHLSTFLNICGVIFYVLVTTGLY